MKISEWPQAGMINWMRGIGTAFLLLVFLLSACARQGATPAVTLEAEQIEAVEDAQRFLAERLDVEMETIELVKVEDAQWRDSCLGLPMDGENCSQVITEGYSITFEAAGKQYILRTDSSGNMVRLETTQE